jgi:hypothetical protein
MSFTGTNPPVVIDTGISLVGATGVKLYLRKPDSTTVTITDVTVDNQTITWQPALTDFSQKGVYQFQVEFTKGAVTYKSDIAKEIFFDPLM